MVKIFLNYNNKNHTKRVKQQKVPSKCLTLNIDELNEDGKSYHILFSF